ncbi:hypothetical protein BaRGS_00002073 [Batillaria attramentaria]|uniref:Uncharacterized protein n=1 Tax=Batillaria attramentaria TaxID=370345 RepID=A0ABD0M602_9CAEN
MPTPGIDSYPIIMLGTGYDLHKICMLDCISTFSRSVFFSVPPSIPILQCYIVTISGTRSAPGRHSVSNAAIAFLSRRFVGDYLRRTLSSSHLHRPQVPPPSPRPSFPRPFLYTPFASPHPPLSTLPAPPSFGVIAAMTTIMPARWHPLYPTF